MTTFQTTITEETLGLVLDKIDAIESDEIDPYWVLFNEEQPELVEFLEMISGSFSEHSSSAATEDAADFLWESTLILWMSFKEIFSNAPFSSLSLDDLQRSFADSESLFTKLQNQDDSQLTDDEFEKALTEKDGFSQPFLLKLVAHWTLEDLQEMPLADEFRLPTFVALRCVVETMATTFKPTLSPIPSC